MSPDRGYQPERVPRRYAESRSAREARAPQRSRYGSRVPLQSTSSVTAKLVALSVVATLVIGGLMAAQMAAGNDPALGPKAAARAKKTSNKVPSTGSSTSGAGTDPYSQSSGGGYYYGGSGDYSGSSGYSGSGGYSGGSSSGSSGYSYSPPPVTSSTS